MSKLNREQLAECVNRREKLWVTVRYKEVRVEGEAVCDPLVGGCEKALVRAKFKHSVKAILDVIDYGLYWEARKV